MNTKTKQDQGGTRSIGLEEITPLLKVIKKGHFD